MSRHSIATLLALCFASTGVVWGDESPHQESNPVYAAMRQDGDGAGQNAVKLPPPSMPDGLGEAEQRRVLDQLGGALYPFDRLTRNSVVAPQITRISALPRDQASPLRTVDFWFVVHADLDALADQQFLQRVFSGEDKPADDTSQADAIPESDLANRGIKVEDPQHEAFGYLNYDLLDRVRIQATTHSYWSRTDESILAATRIDPRFENDPQYPNRWQSLEPSEVSPDQAEPQPYGRLGGYAKFTRLHRPHGALLVEVHIVFAEPSGWFGGTNQLGAKLPPVIQNQVRSARREMILATRAARSSAP